MQMRLHFTRILQSYLFFKKMGSTQHCHKISQTINYQKFVFLLSFFSDLDAENQQKMFELTMTKNTLTTSIEALRENFATMTELLAALTCKISSFLLSKQGELCCC